MSNVGNSRPQIKKYNKIFSIHKKAHSMSASVSCDPPNVGGFTETFLRSTQFGGDIRKFPTNKLLCRKSSVRTVVEVACRTSKLKIAQHGLL